MPENHSCIYVQTAQEAKEAVTELQQEKELAIDLECENNLHHYGMYISLVQIATRDKQWVFDIIQLGSLAGLTSILENDSIKKVFHDVSFDLRILAHEFDCHPKFIRDTKLASTFLQKDNVGLKELMKEYFGLEKKKKFQMADWTARPLKPGMLAYAADDTTHLLELHDKLSKQLKERNHYAWYKEECQDLEHRTWEQKLPVFNEMKGFKKLNDVQKTQVELLFNFREKLAQKVDKPPHFVIGNKKIMEVVKQPPTSPGKWKAIQGVHPIVRRQADRFFQLMQKGRQNPHNFVQEKPKRYNLVQRNHFAKLNRARERVAKDTKLLPHVILNKDQMQHIVLEQNFDCLRPWQEKLLSPYL
jgi:ribonuclease D